MTKIDFKKQDKALYVPKTTPMIIEVPTMTFLMVDGYGNPNDETGEYQQAVELLYGLSYAIKMSAKAGYEIPQFYDYVVLPLEGLWWLNDERNRDFTQKSKFCWTAMIRQPEFVNEEVFAWACGQIKQKKPHLAVEKARLSVWQEGLCVQAMHLGPYDDEKQTIEKIDQFIAEQQLISDISGLSSEGVIRRHHEIYLGDPRKVAPEKMRTVLRHPVRRCQDGGDHIG